MRDACWPASSRRRTSVERGHLDRAVPRIVPKRHVVAIWQEAGRRAATQPLAGAPQDLARHDLAVDLVRALVDLGALGVAHQALDAGLARVATRAEQLDRIGRDPHRGVGGGPFGERRHLGQRLAAILGRGRLPGECPRRRHVPGHLGQHEAQPLLLGQRRAERLPLAEVAAPPPRARPGPARRTPPRSRSDPRRAPTARSGSPSPSVAEPVRRRHLAALEHELGGRTCPDPHLPLVRPEPEAGHPLLDEERRDAQPIRPPDRPSRRRDSARPRVRWRSRSSSRSAGTPAPPARPARPASGSRPHRTRHAARSARTRRAPRRTASPAASGPAARHVPQVTTGYCDRMWTDSDTAMAMSAAPSSSMTSVQAEVREAGPTDRCRERSRGQPERAHRGEQRPVVALGLVALDRPGRDLALRRSREPSTGAAAPRR